MKIRTGDMVVVTTGKDKGKTGQVLRVLPTKNRVVVADINMRTRHIRRAPGRAGSIVKYEASIDASNVMLIDPKSKKRTRVGFAVEKGKKTRIAKRSGEVIKKGVLPKKKDSSVAAQAKDDATVQKAEKKAEEKKENIKHASEEKKSPFWKKMGFGADEMAMEDRAEVDTPSHMNENHSVPSQVQRQSERGSSKNS